MTIHWPDELISDIARRRCVLYLGSGVSRQSKNAKGMRPKTWDEFLLAGAKKVKNSNVKTDIQKLVRRGEYLIACQVLQDNMQKTFNDFVRSEFLDPKFAPSPILESISQLDARIVATPNFDKLYETRVNVLQENSVSIKNYYDGDIAEILRSSRRFVLKVHGSIDNPEKMIFSAKQYATARHSHSSFYSILEALLITNTFVFIGCGLNDPDIKLLLEDYTHKYLIGSKHYFVLAKDNLSSAVRAAHEKTLGVEFLSYPADANHTKLRKAIDELVTAVEASREMIQQTGDW